MGACGGCSTGAETELALDDCPFRLPVLVNGVPVVAELTLEALAVLREALALDEEVLSPFVTADEAAKVPRRTGSASTASWATGSLSATATGGGCCSAART